jgi:hypothetical protein
VGLGPFGIFAELSFVEYGWDQRWLHCRLQIGSRSSDSGLEATCEVANLATMNAVKDVGAYGRLGLQLR